MINKEEFLKKFYPATNEARRNDVERFLDAVNSKVGDADIVEQLSNKEFLCSAFYIQKNGGSISRQHYQKIKGYLLNLFEMYGINGEVPTREAVLGSARKVNYFRSIDDMLAFIDSVGRYHFVNYNPTADLVMVKAICVLGWLGYTPEEIAALKISDLTLTDANTYQLTRETETFELSGEPFAALYHLTHLEVYRAIPTGTQRTLQTTKTYLFRPTIRYNTDHLEATNITQVIKRFNDCMPASLNHKAIVFRNLYKNALFVEIYEDKRDISLMGKITTIMKCSQNSALNYREQYWQFANAIENNKI